MKATNSSAFDYSTLVGLSSPALVNETIEPGAGSADPISPPTAEAAAEAHLTLQEPLFGALCLSASGALALSNSTPWRLRARSAMRLLALLFLALPLVAQAQFAFTTNADNTITITRYTGPGGEVSIPNTTNGYPVTSIETNAFSQCYSVTSVTIPDNVTNIGNYAFSYCSGMTRVVVGTGLTRIGDRAFASCARMAEIYFHGNAPSLGAYVFSINYNETVYYYSGTGWGPTFGGLPAELLYLPYTCITSNNTVTIIGYLDYYDPVGVANIPDTINGLPVACIGTAAFNSSTSLKSVTIGTNVASIGMVAFQWCRSLTNVTLPNSVTTLGDAAFEGCPRLTSISLPASVTSIGSQAIYGCSSLKTILVDALNPAYSSVDGVLFDKSQTTLIQCPGGKVGTYTVPGGVTNILTSALAACSSLTAITVDAGNSFYSSADGVLFDKNQATLIQWPNGKGGNYTVPDGVTSIARDAFVGCNNLISVSFSASVTNIGDAAFWSCSSLTGVYFKGDAPSLGGDKVFYVDSTTIYYLPGTAGWDATFGGRPTALWSLPYPLILNSRTSLGIQTNGFAFMISWATNVPVVVEASTGFGNSIWLPVSTNTLTDGWSFFSDADWTNYPARFYRVRSP